MEWQIDLVKMFKAIATTSLTWLGSLALLILIIESSKDKSPLTVNCNQIHSINYDKRTNVDYYYANRRANYEPNKIKVTANLKSILPSNLASVQSSESIESALPQVAHNLAVVRGNGPRGRSAKQIQAFNGELQEANTSAISKADVCLTPGCVMAAAEILKNIDDKVDPCDDFYKYSCGNWIEAQVIPEDKTSVSLFSVVQDELDNKLRNLIEREPSSEKVTPPIVSKMRNLYESCMNTSKYHGANETSNVD